MARAGAKENMFVLEDNVEIGDEVLLLGMEDSRLDGAKGELMQLDTTSAQVRLKSGRVICCKSEFIFKSSGMLPTPATQAKPPASQAKPWWAEDVVMKELETSPPRSVPKAGRAWHRESTTNDSIDQSTTNDGRRMSGRSQPERFFLFDKPAHFSLVGPEVNGVDRKELQGEEKFIGRQPLSPAEESDDDDDDDMPPLVNLMRETDEAKHASEDDSDSEDSEDMPPLKAIGRIAQTTQEDTSKKSPRSEKQSWNIEAPVFVPRSYCPENGHASSRIQREIENEKSSSDNDEMPPLSLKPGTCAPVQQASRVEAREVDKENDKLPSIARDNVPTRTSAFDLNQGSGCGDGDGYLQALNPADDTDTPQQHNAKLCKSEEVRASFDDQDDTSDDDMPPLDQMRKIAASDAETLQRTCDQEKVARHGGDCSFPAVTSQLISNDAFPAVVGINRYERLQRNQRSQSPKDNGARTHDHRTPSKDFVETGTAETIYTSTRAWLESQGTPAFSADLVRHVPVQINDVEVKRLPLVKEEDEVESEDEDMPKLERLPLVQEEDEVDSEDEEMPPIISNSSQKLAQVMRGWSAERSEEQKKPLNRRQGSPPREELPSEEFTSTSLSSNSGRQWKQQDVVDDSNPPHFEAGDRVKLDNLSMTHLNGEVCVVVTTRFQKGRIEVQRDNGDRILVKLANLVFVSRGGEDGSDDGMPPLLQNSTSHARQSSSSSGPSDSKLSMRWNGIKPGDYVELRGLARREYNGLKAQVLPPNREVKRNRVAVKCCSTGSILAVNANRLIKLRQPPPTPKARGGGGGGGGVERVGENRDNASSSDESDSLPPLRLVDDAKNGPKPVHAKGQSASSNSSATSAPRTFKVGQQVALVNMQKKQYANAIGVVLPSDESEDHASNATHVCVQLQSGKRLLVSAGNVVHLEKGSGVVFKHASEADKQMYFELILHIRAASQSWDPVLIDDCLCYWQSLHDGSRLGSLPVSNREKNRLRKQIVELRNLQREHAREGNGDAGARSGGRREEKGYSRERGGGKGNFSQNGRWSESQNAGGRLKTSTSQAFFEQGGPSASPSGVFSARAHRGNERKRESSEDRRKLEESGGVGVGIRPARHPAKGDGKRANSADGERRARPISIPSVSLPPPETRPSLEKRPTWGDVLHGTMRRSLTESPPPEHRQSLPEYGQRRMQSPSRTMQAPRSKSPSSRTNMDNFYREMEVPAVTTPHMYGVCVEQKSGQGFSSKQFPMPDRRFPHSADVGKPDPWSERYEVTRRKTSRSRERDRGGQPSVHAFSPSGYAPRNSAPSSSNWVHEWCEEHNFPRDLEEKLVAEEVRYPEELAAVSEADIVNFISSLKLGLKGRFVNAVRRLRDELGMA